MEHETNNRFSNYLGMKVLNLTETGCTVGMEIHPDLYNSIEGVVHGGATYSLADMAMGHGAAPPIEGVQQCVTLECKINYLAPMKGAYLKAEAKVLKRGGRVIVMEAHVTSEDGMLVAVALGTYARVSPNKPTSKGV